MFEYTFGFIVWWYLYKLPDIFRDLVFRYVYALNITKTLPMVLNLFHPLYGDNSQFGFIFGFVFRLIWFFFGFIFCTIYILPFVIFFIFFVMAPLLPIVQLVNLVIYSARYVLI